MHHRVQFIISLKIGSYCVGPTVALNCDSPQFPQCWDYTEKDRKFRRSKVTLLCYTNTSNQCLLLMYVTGCKYPGELEVY